MTPKMLLFYVYVYVSFIGTFCSYQYQAKVTIGTSCIFSNYIITAPSATSHCTFMDTSIYIAAEILALYNIDNTQHPPEKRISMMNAL